MMGCGALLVARPSVTDALTSIATHADGRDELRTQMQMQRRYRSSERRTALKEQPNANNALESTEEIEKNR